MWLLSNQTLLRNHVHKQKHVIGTTRFIIMIENYVHIWSFSFKAMQRYRIHMSCGWMDRRMWTIQDASTSQWGINIMAIYREKTYMCLPFAPRVKTIDARPYADVAFKASDNIPYKFPSSFRQWITFLTWRCPASVTYGTPLLFNRVPAR